MEKVLIRLFKALSEPTRIKILKLLLEKNEMSVSEIMDTLKLSQSRASRNLNILKNVGFVRDRKDSTRVYYSIGNDPKLKYNQILLSLLSGWHLNEGKSPGLAGFNPSDPRVQRIIEYIKGRKSAI